jgi:phage baseplate assembly protein W
VSVNVDYPFRIDGRGRTAIAGDDDHIRDMIEQLLFTVPGERVNRPDFGAGLLQLVFAPNSDALAAATQFAVAAALQQWLGDVVEVQNVTVENDDAKLTVTVEYIDSKTREEHSAQFTRGGGV